MKPKFYKIYIVFSLIILAGFAYSVKAAYITTPDTTWTLSGSNLFPVSTSYSVGIGTTSPAHPLDVNGNILARGANILFADLGTTNREYITSNDSGISGLNTLGVFGFFADTSLGGSITSPTAGISAKGIYSNGYVGIGIASPNKQLHVYSTSPNAEIDIQSVLGAGNQWGLYNEITDNSFRIWGGDNYVSIKRDGKIGIGTTNPIGKLFVGSNWRTSHGGTDLYIGSGAGITNTSNLGITYSASSSATAAPSTVGITLYNDDATAGGWSPLLLFSKAESGPTPYKATMAGIAAKTPTGIGSGDSWIDGELHFYTAGTGTNGLVDRMVINKDGNVGIGTTNPQARLDLGGGTSGRIVGIDTNPAAVRGDSDVVPKKWIVDNFAPVGTGAGSAFVQGGNSFGTKATLGTNDSQTLAFETAGSERMTILSGGNVGIGNTNPSTYKLDVIGSIRSSDYGAGGSVNFLVGDDAYLTDIDSANTLGIYGVQNSAISSIKLGSGGGIISGYSGNIGIGTTSPASKLTIQGVSATDSTPPPVNLNLRTSYGTGTSQHGIGFYVNSSSFLGSGIFAPPGALSFFTSSSWSSANAVERMRIDTAGNVGIGTTNPTAKLDVNGNAKISDWLTLEKPMVGDVMGVNLIPNAQMESDAHWDQAPNQSIVVGPYGNEIYAHESIESGTTCYNWAMTAKIPVDEHKTYKFSIWIKALTADESNYFGYHTYNSAGTQLSSNPYFRSGQSPSTWTLYESILGPSHATNCQTSQTNGTDFCMESGTAYVLMRFGSCYGNGDNTGRTYYTMPMIQEVSSSDLGTTGNYFIGGQLDVNGLIKMRGTLITQPEDVINKNYLTSALDSFNSQTNLWKLNGSDLYASSTSWNVGIGTTDPTQKLDVNGILKLGSATNVLLGLSANVANRASLTLNSTSGNPADIVFKNGSVTTGNFGQWTISARNGNTDYRFSIWRGSENGGVSSESEVLSIAPSGNVGIGTTAPASRLNISETTGTVHGASTGSLIIDHENSGGASSIVFRSRANRGSDYGYIQYQDSSTVGAVGELAKLIIGTSNDGTDDVVIMPTGSFGINTMSPGYKLDAYTPSTVDAYYRFQRQNTTKAVGLVLSDATVSRWYLQMPTGSNDFHINSGSTNRFTILNSNGYVGIGTTSPTEKLHVIGNAKISASLYASGASLSGNLLLNKNDIEGVNKLTVMTIDPLYRINGINYSTFAPSFVGGVKEEIAGKIKIEKKVAGEYQAVIDFSKVSLGSDLWVWYNVIDFNKESVEVSLTPYGGFANTYYYIDGKKLVLKADRPVEVSYRLTAKRFDWKEWPTKAIDQNEKPGFIID